ncbi:natural killer cell receptor 2B4-like isoform X2 [Triplophysa rosa]|uniref:natural killer cell receptor 2B4-like isoform X2 n=1 Tax=Triplophysa rosa TaxID=992332 RepID=UPI002545C356|nr:natural killer cell receptor 2B4-like isoform X2 [Triplophysa rosa]
MFSLWICFYAMWSYYQKIIQCFFCLYLLLMNGVFGVDGDEVKSVMEGDSVTLHTHLTHIQTQDYIRWRFGAQETNIAEIYKQSIDMFDSNKTFGDRLKLDSQTGSLTITNITITDSGLYKLTVISLTGTSYKTFNVTVYVHFPVPVINRDCSSSSERSPKSNCSVLCSVMNVTRVSLSWYKGKSLLSSISVSDLIIRLSLPLEVEYQDTNTYRCVINNPITNHTQHLNINDVCQPCSDPLPSHFIVLIAVAVMLPVVISVFLFWRFKKCKKPSKHDQTLEEEVLYTEPNISTQQFHNTVRYFTLLSVSSLYCLAKVLYCMHDQH